MEEMQRGAGQWEDEREDVHVVLVARVHVCCGCAQREEEADKMRASEQEEWRQPVGGRRALPSSDWCQRESKHPQADLCQVGFIR